MELQNSTSLNDSLSFGNTSSGRAPVRLSLREGLVTSYAENEKRYFPGGSANMKLRILKDSVNVATKEWSVPHAVADTSKLISGQKLVGIQAFALPPGKYL